MVTIRFIGGRGTSDWIYIYIYIPFLRLPSTSDLPTLASLIISSRKTWIPYLILLSDLYSKGKQLSPLEGSCFQHLYIALRGRVPRCRPGFWLAPLLDVRGWHHIGRPMGPYVDVPTTGVEYVRFEVWTMQMLARLKSRLICEFPPFLFAISIATLGPKGQTQTPPAWSALFLPLFWFFSVSLPKKNNLEDVSSFLGGDENPSNSRQLLPPDHALGRSEFCMQENQLHEETLGMALERAFLWWIWQQLRGKMAESNRIPLRCIGALVCRADNSTRWSQRLPGF